MIPGIHPPSDPGTSQCRVCEDIAEIGRQFPVGARVTGRRLPGADAPIEYGVIVSGRAPDRALCPHQLLTDAGEAHVAANQHNMAAVLVAWDSGDRGWRSPRGLVRVDEPTQESTVDGVERERTR